MNSHDSTKQPGPFELEDPSEPESSTSAALRPVSEPARADEFPYVRELDCNNYAECLNLAVALNWSSFTCHGCSGEVNQSLVWRAHHAAKRDLVAKKLCRLQPNSLAIASEKRLLQDKGL